MTINKSIFNSTVSVDIHQQAMMQKGNLDRNDLSRYGRELTTTCEKVGLFFKGIWNTLLHGSEEATNRKESYFAHKTIHLIKTLNEKILSDKMPDLTTEEFHSYLFMLKDNEVLVSRSPNWKKFTPMHQNNLFKEEVVKNENHWLQAFAEENDLGKNLEQIEPAELDGNINALMQLDQLHKKALIPDFVPLLKFVLGEGKLKDITPEQFTKFESCLEIYNLSSFELTDERLKNTIVLFNVLENLKKNLGSKIYKDFKQFITDNSIMRDLIIRICSDSTQLTTSSSEHLYKISQLVPKLPKIPEQALLSTTLDEVIQNLTEELEMHDPAIIAKRYGESFLKAYVSFKGNKEQLTKTLLNLETIRKNFKLCKKSPLFLELMSKAMGNGLQDKEFEALPEKIRKQIPTLYSAIEITSEKTRNYLNMGLHPGQVNAFQEEALQEFTKPNARSHSREKVEQTIHHIEVKFNKRQFEDAKKEWVSRYGAPIVDHLSRLLGPKVANGETHYLNNKDQMLGIGEIDKLFVQFGAIEKEMGSVFTSHVIDYMLSEEGKVFKNQPDFLKKEWPQLLEQLKEVKAQFAKQDITPEDFNKALENFITKSAYANTNENWLILTPEALDKFSQSLQHEKNEKTLSEMSDSYGKSFVTLFYAYLKDNEPNVLLGKQSLKDSSFFSADSFGEQLRLYIIPYLIVDIPQKYPVLNEEIIPTLFLRESVTPQNFQAMFVNLPKLQKLIPQGAKPFEQKIIQEFIKVLSPTYLADLSSDPKKFDSALSDMKETIQELVKFCTEEVEIDKKPIYSPNLLARAFHQLMVERGETKDSPAVRLQNTAKKCNKIKVFNKDTVEIIKQFNMICLKLYIEDSAKEITSKTSIEVPPNVQMLINGLLNRFANQGEGLKNASAAAYVKDIVQFATELSISYEVPIYTIIKQFIDEIDNKNLTFDLAKMNVAHPKKPLVVSEDIKEKITAEVKKAAGKTKKNMDGIFAVVQNDPFRLVYELAPRLLENVLDEEDKDRVKDVRKAMQPLGPIFNQSKTVAKGVDLLIGVGNIISKTKVAEPAKQLIAEKVVKFNQLDINEIANLQERSKIRQALDAKDLGIWMTVTELVTDKLVDFHAKFHDKSKAEELKNDPLATVFLTILPKLIEDRKSVEDWIGRMPVIIPVIRTFGGGWLANQILQRYVGSKLKQVDKLSGLEKKIITESLESIIKIALLASPTLIKNHPLETYFDFLEKISVIMKSEETPNEHDLFFSVMEIIQHGLQEGTIYGPMIEDTLNHVENKLGH